MIAYKDLQQLPKPPRRLPWIILWYLYFQHPSMHIVYGGITLIFVFGLPELPYAVSALLPWQTLGRQASAHIVSIDETMLFGKEDEVGTDWATPTGCMATYRYSYIGTGKRTYVGTTRELGKPQYAMGEMVTVRYLPCFPYLSQIEGVAFSYNGHEFFFGLAMPLLAVVILISVALVQFSFLASIAGVELPPLISSSTDLSLRSNGKMAICTRY